LKEATKRQRAKQEDLPGMEQRDIEAIVQAAERYRETRDERMRLSKLESEQKQDLIAVMKKHDKSYYTYRGLTVALSEEINVKVKAKDDDMDAEASTRNTREMVADLKNAVKPPAPDPTPEESESNVVSFFSNQEANAEVEESLAEAAADDFTAPKCEECGAIGGAHAVSCSKSNGLTFDDYLGYAKAKNVKHAASWARKWQLSREKDGLVLAWKAEGATKAATRVTKSKPQTSSAKSKNTPAQKGGKR